MLRIVALVAVMTVAGGAPAQSATPPAKAPAKPAPKAAPTVAPKPAAKPKPKPVAAALPSIPATGDLGEVDLLTIARKRMSNMRTDAFTGEVTKQYDGRRFIIRQRVTSKLNSNWDYSIDGQILLLSTDDLHEISLFYKTTPRGSFIGQTAMGVKFRIEKSDETSVVLSITNGYGLSNISYRVPLPPDEARRLAAGAMVVLEGNLEANDGVLTECGLEELNASLDDPTLVNRFECRIRATLTRIALEDPSGKVLAAWP